MEIEEKRGPLLHLLTVMYTDEAKEPGMSECSLLGVMPLGFHQLKIFKFHLAPDQP